MTADRRRAALLLAALVLALLAGAAVVLADDARWLRLGIVAALWAALLSAVALARRGHTERAGDRGGHGAEADADAALRAENDELEERIAALQADHERRLAREVSAREESEQTAERAREKVAGLRERLARLGEDAETVTVAASPTTPPPAPTPAPPPAVPPAPPPASPPAAAAYAPSRTGAHPVAPANGRANGSGPPSRPIGDSGPLGRRPVPVGPVTVPPPPAAVPPRPRNAAGPGRTDHADGPAASLPEQGMRRPPAEHPRGDPAVLSGESFVDQYVHAAGYAAAADDGTEWDAGDDRYDRGGGRDERREPDPREARHGDQGSAGYGGPGDEPPATGRTVAELIAAHAAAGGSGGRRRRDER